MTMCKITRLPRSLMGIICVSALCLVGTAHGAGIPEPSIIFHGGVYDQNSQLQTNGMITVSLLRQGTTESSIVSSALELIDGGTGPDGSFIVQFPLETLLSGQTASANTLKVVSGTQTYDRSATIVIAGITYGPFVDTVQLEGDDLRGATMTRDYNLQITQTPSPTPTPTSTATATATPTSTATATPAPGTFLGDADLNGIVNAFDYLHINNALFFDYSCYVCRGKGDADGNKIVNAFDYLRVNQNLFQTYNVSGMCVVETVPCASSKSTEPTATPLWDDKQTTAAIMRLLPSASTVTVGSTLVVTVQIEAGNNLVGLAGARILFDDSLINVSNAALNTAVFNVAGTANVGAGTIDFGGLAGTAQTGTFTLGTFTVTGEAVGSAPFSFETNPAITNLADATGTPIEPLDLVGSTYTVEPAAAPSNMFILSAAKSTIEVGESLLVTVQVDAQAPFALFGTRIHFDPALIAVDGAALNSTLFNVAGTANVGTTTVDFGGLSSTTGTGLTNLGTITIRGVAEGQSALIFETNPAITNLADAQGTPLLPVSTQNRQFTIVAPQGDERLISIPDTLFALQGQTISVPILIDDASGVVGFRLAVDFSSPLLSFVPGTARLTGGIAGTCFTPEVNEANPDELILSASCASALSGGGTLVTLEVVVSPAALTGTTIPVPFSVDICRLNDGQIDAIYDDGTITVGRFLWGDIAPCPLDGVAGTLDVAAALRYDAFIIDTFPCFGTTRPLFPPPGDVNGDDILGTLDGSLILQYDAQLIEYFPVDANQDGYGPDTIIKDRTWLRYGASQLTASITLDAGGVSEGDIFVVEVLAQEVQDLVGYRLGIVYDTSALEFLEGESVKSNTLSRAMLDPAVRVSDTGAVLSSTGMVKLSEESGVLLRLPFRALPGASGKGAIAIAVDQKVSRLNDGLLNASFAGTEITVKPATSVWDWNILD